MNTIAAVLAFLAALPSEDGVATTSTEVLASAPTETADVSVGAAAVGGSSTPGLGYVLGGVAAVAGGAVMLGDGGSDNRGRTQSVPEPASLAVLGLGAMALRRRRKA